jgi:hypothetical protein
MEGTLMTEEMIKHVLALPDAIGEALDPFGGVLRCEVCKETREMNKGDAGNYVVHGWPMHCGYNMRWWTQRQIDEREMQ